MVQGLGFKGLGSWGGGGVRKAFCQGSRRVLAVASRFLWVRRASGLDSR